MTRWMVVFGSLIGCTGAAGTDTTDDTADALDAEAVLLALGEVDRTLLDELKAAVGYDEVALHGQVADSGWTTFWRGRVEGAPLTVASEVFGTGRYLVEDDTFRHVWWTLDVQYADLSLDGMATSGSASMVIEEELFESAYHEVLSVGQLDVGGFGYAGLATLGQLERVEGHLGGEAVDWETDDPDVP